MDLGVNCQEFFRALIADLSGKTKVDIGDWSDPLKKSASIFDTDKNNVLDSKELYKFLDVFYKADMGGGEVDGKLSDKEIEVSLNNYNRAFKNVDIKTKKALLLEVYSKVLAQEIKAQIDGPSVNQRTIDRLRKINAENVLEVLEEYDRISPKETLASAIDNEWRLDYKTVQDYICKWLKQRAESLGIKNIQDYKTINDINKLNTYISNLVKQIENAKVPQSTSVQSEANTPAQPKRSQLEQKVYDAALDQAIRRVGVGKGKKAKKIEDILPKDRQKYIDLANRVTDMVMRLTKKYEIEDLAPLIADMMGYETGGYDFSNKVLKNEGRKYKGVMQVDFETCQCIFSEGPQKNKDWHKKHFTQDDKRIAGLKAKYKTASQLYSAIQKDVELGLEVGIIAYKAKLSVAKGDVHKALAMYCGSQYKTTTSIPSRFIV